MDERQVRISLREVAGEGQATLAIPVKSVAMGLADLDGFGDTGSLEVDAVYANGDGLSITTKRVPVEKAQSKKKPPEVERKDTIIRSDRVRGIERTLFDTGHRQAMALQLVSICHRGEWQSPILTFSRSIAFHSASEASTFAAEAVALFDAYAHEFGG